MLFQKARAGLCTFLKYVVLVSSPLMLDSMGSKLPKQINIPSSVPNFKEPIQAIDLHGFGDASGDGTSAAVYAVVYQEAGVSQGIVEAKRRIAKKGLTIPRLELVSGQMVAKMTHNIRGALEGLL